MDRPRRLPEDGRTMLQKAQDLKKAKNANQGRFLKTSFAFESNESLLQKAGSINISFGDNLQIVNNKLDSPKDRELCDRSNFEEENPEVNLLGDLEVNVVAESFPPLTIDGGLPKGPVVLSPQSWVQIASKRCGDNSNSLENDRSIFNIRGLNKEGQLQCLTDFVNDQFRFCGYSRN